MCLSVCYAPCYDPMSTPREGHKALEWFGVPSDVSVPSQLRGIFWADGNWDPSLLNFTTAYWDGAKREMYFKTYAPDAWASTTHLSQSACACGSYHLYFNSDVTVGDIRSTFDWPCIKVGCFCCNCAESCLFIADFKMTQQKDPNIWLRESVILRPCCGSKLKETYNLTRVIDEHGQKTPHYDRMAAAKETEHLFTRTPCPAYCGLDATHYASKKHPASKRVQPSVPGTSEMAR